MSRRAPGGRRASRRAAGGRRVSRRAAGAVAGLLVAGVVAGGAAAAWRQLHGVLDRATVVTAEVVSERFVRRVIADGNLRAVEATPLITPVDARTSLKVAWLIEEGARVRKGDVVVRFDPTGKQRELADGEAARAAAEHKIASEKVQVDAAIRGRDRAAHMAAREREQSSEFQAMDELIFSRNQIIESQIDDGLAAAKEAHAAAVKDVERSVSRSRIALLDIERRAAAFKVDEAERVLASMELRAPHDGVVVLRRNWAGIPIRVGDTVWSGQALAEIPLVETMEAEVFVLEADASGLEPGKPAQVTVQSRPGQPYAAKIAKVDTLARPRHEDVPVQYFAVTLELERTDPELMKPGQRVRAELVLDDRDALVVPRQAVFDRGGDGESPWVVYRRDGDGFVQVAVDLGPSTPGRVVIERGLAAGDRVALRDPTRPDGGDRPERAGDPADDAPPSAAGPGVGRR